MGTEQMNALMASYTTAWLLIPVEHLKVETCGTRNRVLIRDMSSYTLPVVGHCSRDRKVSTILYIAIVRKINGFCINYNLKSTLRDHLHQQCWQH